MRVLFLTSHFPYPPHSGGALRAFGLMRGAAEAGHSLSLLCFAANPPQNTPLHEWCEAITIVPPPVRQLKDRLRDLALTAQPDMGRRFWSEAMVEALRKLLAERTFDLVHAESLEMAAYLPLIHDWYPQLPLIYGSLNAEADLQRTMFSTDRRNPHRLIGAAYSWVQWRRLTRFEGHICNISAHVLAVSEPDRVLLQKLAQTPVTVVENGIDIAPYLQMPRNQAFGEQTIVFTGTMDYRPNVDAVMWFSEAILPAIVAKFPHVRFYVVGQRPHARLEPLRENPHIVITGAVPEIAPYLQGAQVYIAPLRMGSGTRFKLLEAMAAGCGVVSTEIGAQGLGVQSGQEMLIADTPVDFANCVNNLLTDASRRKEIGEAARQFVQTHFDWSAIVPRLLDVYARLEKSQTL
ncbi:MAG: glycosyltransferase [Chloroflexi bacterium]|nr:glycosyltransferase [Chloroflexota bacterium]